MNITAATATKFHTLTLVENGILLGYGNRKERAISFSELDKIYIKRYKLNPFLEFVFILFPFTLVFLSDQYFSLDIVTFTALFTIVPIFILVRNYTWYRLKIHLKEGSLFEKKLSLDLKTETVTIINKINSECFSYNINSKMVSA